MQPRLTFNDPPKDVCCESCGGKLTGRWERLNAGLCATLVKFYEQAIFVKESRLHILNECGFTTNQINNFQKLSYFGLVEQTEIAGVWRITDKGVSFLKNKLAVTRRVYVFRNEVRERSEDKIFITDAVKEIPYWLKKSDYVASQATVDI